MEIHGSFKLSVTGEIVIISYFDSWNEDCSIAFITEFKKLILEKQFEKYGVLTDFRKLQGGTPEAIELIKGTSLWSFQQGQIARAQLFDSEFSKFIISKALDNRYFPVKTFQDQKQALGWLEQQGLKIGN